MRNPSITEQFDEYALQARITREARESEKVLLDEIKILRAALQFAVDDAVEWRGHRGKVLAVGVVQVKFESGNVHVIYAADLKRSTATKGSDHAD